MHRPPISVPQQERGPVELLFGLYHALLATSHDHFTLWAGRQWREVRVRDALYA